jgi:hypothetical protein
MAYVVAIPALAVFACLRLDAYPCEGPDRRRRCVRRSALLRSYSHLKVSAAATGSTIAHATSTPML